MTADRPGRLLITRASWRAKTRLSPEETTALSMNLQRSKFWNRERKWLLAVTIIIILLVLFGEWDNWTDDQPGVQPNPAAGIRRTL